MNQGRLLEERVLSEIKDVVDSCHLTAGSGAFHDNGDIVVEGPPLLIECKYRERKNIILDHSVIEKVRLQASRAGRDWAIASENSEGNIVVSMSISTFTYLLGEIHEPHG